jgi:hypothetical protein
MNRKEILEAMEHNAKAMVSMGTENEDMEMALVGHSTLTALAAIQRGDCAELSITLIAFHELTKAKREGERENAEMPEGIESMLNEMGIATSR